MKFSKLVKVITEAKGVGPGNALYNAMNSEKPKGMPSQSAGFSDNNQLPQPSDKWEFDSLINKGQSGFSAESKIWKSMLTSFRLLFNDPFFDKQVQKISTKFNSSRDSYKNIKGFDENGMAEKYDEENQLEKLERNQSKYNSDLTGMRDEIKRYTIIINRTKLSPSEKNQMELEITMMEAKFKKLNEQMQREKTEKRRSDFKLKLDELATILTKKRDRYDDATMKPADVDKLKLMVLDIEEKMERWEEKLEKVNEELESLYTRINTINATNERANEIATGAFLDLVTFTAGGLLADYREVAGGQTLQSLDQLDWNTTPKNLEDAISRLEALESTDENVNPIIGYLRKFERNYADKDFDSNRELDKNVNITKARDFNRMPYMVLSRIYSSVRSSDKTPIAMDKLDTTQTDATKGELIALLTKLSTDTPENKAEWSNPNTKSYIKDLIDQLVMPPFSKDTFKNRVDGPWVLNKSKKTPAMLLKMNIEDETKLKNESFDKYFDSLLTSMRYDEDDFKIDMIEVLSR